MGMLSQTIIVIPKTDTLRATILVLRTLWARMKAWSRFKAHEKHPMYAAIRCLFRNIFALPQAIPEERLCWLFRDLGSGSMQTINPNPEVRV